MSIFEHLKSDHRKVQSLLDRLVSSSEKETEGWKKLVDEIRDELIPHSRAEEAVFYNSIRDLDPGNTEVRHAFAEHLKAETNLRALQAMKAIDVNWTALAKQLREDVMHHVSEEEQKIFPIARRLFSEEEADGIGKAFQEMKPAIRDQSMLKTTLELVTNLLPTRLVDSFRQRIEDFSGKKSA
jgi:hemerythrin superfamily protein